MVSLANTCTDHKNNNTTCAPYLQDVCVGLALVGILELGVPDEDGVHVGAGILVELVVAGDHDHSYLHVTEDAQFIRLLQQATLALAECDLQEGG